PAWQQATTTRTTSSSHHPCATPPRPTRATKPKLILKEHEWRSCGDTALSIPLPPPPGYGKFPTQTTAQILSAQSPQGSGAAALPPGSLPPGMTLDQYLRLKQMGMV